MGVTSKKKVINVYSSLNDELLNSYDYDDYFGYGFDDELYTKTCFTNYSFNRLLYRLLEQKDNFYVKVGYKGE